MQAVAGLLNGIHTFFSKYSISSHMLLASRFGKWEAKQAALRIVLQTTAVKAKSEILEEKPQ